MELRQLTYFDAIVRHGGFTRAAEQLRVAQPAISAQLRRLESELGVTLLSRTTRRVELTQAGELVLARTRLVLEELDGVRSDLTQLTGILRGRVRISAIQASDPLDLPGVLASFHARYPDVKLTLRSGPLRSQLRELTTDQVDLAIGPLREEIPEQLTVQPLFTDELVLLTPPAHALAGKRALRLDAVSGEPFVCLPVDSGLRAILDRACETAGFTPYVPFESSNLQRIRALVANGLGNALLARSVAEADGPPVAVHSVAPEPLWRPVGVIHDGTRPLSPAAATFRDFLLTRSSHDGDGGRGGPPTSNKPPFGESR